MTERLFDSRREAREHRKVYQSSCGALHAMGTGEIMLYGRGPEWMQVLGAPYSCPTAFSLVVPEGDDVRSRSFRRPCSGGWSHRLAQGRLDDCASRMWDCLARRWNLTAPLRLELDALDHPMEEISALCPEAAGAWLITVPAGSPIYNDYPLMRPTFMLIAVDGGCRAERTEAGLLLTLFGEGTLVVVGGQDYPACFGRLQKALKVPFEEMMTRCDADDKAFLNRCRAGRAPLREHPLAQCVMEAAEDVLLLTRAQQHSGGGIQAGHNYHLGYVRDQYGTSRGLLAAGALEEARKLLCFDRDVFGKSGRICNAQAMGVDGIFHVHENDRVEITGYLLLQATEYLEASGDAEFFLSLLPLLRWALDEQLHELHRDMLPFNGDETYVAGGLLPRTALNHGSFEATLLLIEGGTRFMDACERLSGEEPWMEEPRRRISLARARFDENFRRADGYVANSLLRTEGLEEPEFRHGVCCADFSFGWTHRAGEGVYLCPSCFGKRTAEPCREEYRLKSTLMMAPFIGSSVPDNGLIRRQTQEILNGWRENGALPSLPSGNRCLGYDFGLLLFAAAETGCDADDLLAHMLSLRDDCGAWAEYYERNQPRQTRCRPWESSMNIAGALRYLAVKK